ncbi:universal stress protein [Arthrobacter sp. Soil736]|uniref:universal stress protein n=1 Tax=Arthrobacter sp. Soil736 TaxID=1736395 RepID=UPI0006F27ADC|nr:universal stress protein [Arthrobacter sp. Soil736]KRE65018.1 universal stress protein [Arthrobacter sp. Soil736]
MHHPDCIVVGYDGSVEAGQAVRWAARQAELRNCELHLVHCSLWPLLTHDLGPVPGVADSGLQHYAEAVRDEGKALAVEAAPGLKTRTSLLYGWPADHLRRVSAEARMLVLGSRGIGGFMGLLVGSVSLELAATASCPVAVVRSDDHPSGPIVVGVDSSGSPAALHDACELVRATGADLKVIHVLRMHFGAGKGGVGSVGTRKAAEKALESAVRNARGMAPGARVEEELVEDTSTPRALLNAARGAALIVVGTKGQGLVRGTVGSTAHAVLHHARCPVLISRHNPEETSRA